MAPVGSRHLGLWKPAWFAVDTSHDTNPSRSAAALPSSTFSPVPQCLGLLSQGNHIQREYHHPHHHHSVLQNGPLCYLKQAALSQKTAKLLCTVTHGRGVPVHGVKVESQFAQLSRRSSVPWSVPKPASILSFIRSPMVGLSGLIKRWKPPFTAWSTITSRCELSA